MGSQPANTWSGCVSFLIQRSSDFESSLAKALSTNYKKDKKGREEFLGLLLAPFFGDIEQNGPRSPYLEAEPWPTGTYTPGWDLCKYRFRMPRLSGAAAKGRIIVAVNQPLYLIYPLIAYTHKQYGSRPPERAIAGLLKTAISDAQAIAGQQQGPAG
jgi:hypothetical protein